MSGCDNEVGQRCLYIAWHSIFSFPPNERNIENLWNTTPYSDTSTLWIP